MAKTTIRSGPDSWGGGGLVKDFPTIGTRPKSVLSARMKRTSLVLVIAAVDGWCTDNKVIVMIVLELKWWWHNCLPLLKRWERFLFSLDVERNYYLLNHFNIICLKKVLYYKVTELFHVLNVSFSRSNLIYNVCNSALIKVEGKAKKNHAWF